MRALILLLWALAGASYAMAPDIEQLMMQAQMRAQGGESSSLGVEKAPPMPPGLLFVSFSIPDQSLKSYLIDAQKVGIPLIIPGLIDDSFRKTTAKIQTLISNEAPGGFQINPKPFLYYEITKVPTLVIFPQSCTSNPCQNFDAITGNIGLAAALRQISHHGSNQKEAAHLLDKLEPKHA